MKTPLRHLMLPLAALVVLSTARSAWADYSSTVLSFNPVGYWRLSETVSPPPPNIVANSGSLGATADGYLNPGTDLVKGVPGVVGSSIAFTNPSASFNYDSWSIIDVPWNAAFNPRGPFTIEFWGKPNGHATDLVCPICSLNVDQSRSGWLVYHDSANSRWEFRIGVTASYAGTIDSP